MKTNIRYGQLADELERHESIWESKDITNYQYILGASANFGVAAVAVRVEEGNSAISRRLESRYRGELSEILLVDITNYDTVPDLFDRIRDILEAKEENNYLKQDN